MDVPMKKLLCFPILGLLLLTSCRQETKPQRPTFLNRVTEDTVATIDDEFVLLNERMASDADQQLMAYASMGYQRHEKGMWVKGLHGHGDTISRDTTIRIHYEVMSLDSVPLSYMDSEEEVSLNQNELCTAIRAVLREGHQGDHITIISPWYAAYGTIGAGLVPPYTNVRIELDIR